MSLLKRRERMFLILSIVFLLGQNFRADPWMDFFENKVFFLLPSFAEETLFAHKKLPPENMTAKMHLPTSNNISVNTTLMSLNASQGTEALRKKEDANSKTIKPPLKGRFYSKDMTARNYINITWANGTWLGKDTYYVSFDAYGESPLNATSIVIESSYWENRHRREVNRKIRNKYQLKKSHNFSSWSSLDRIYYINLDKNRLRRSIMESWLSRQPFRYQRVPALRGEEDICVSEKKGKPCIGISGVARSNVHIMDYLNTTGTTLVIEDDVVIKDMNKLLASVHLVPDDWDILRWDCWHRPLPYFPKYPLSFSVVPFNKSICSKYNIDYDDCWFCGGNHIAMWREKSVDKLRKVWSARPHDDIDCLLSDASINSYCINVGVGEFHIPVAEESDIAKIGDKANSELEIVAEE